MFRSTPRFSRSSRLCRSNSFGSFRGLGDFLNGLLGCGSNLGSGLGDGLGKRLGGRWTLLDSLLAGDAGLLLPVVEVGYEFLWGLLAVALRVVGYPKIIVLVFVQIHIIHNP
jgi:cytochrome c oxidase subunit IV